MKLHILSDLHLEFDPFPMPSTDADIVVLAGDIDLGTGGLAWAMNAIRKPVIYVPGNHEFYFRHMNKTAIEMREIAAGSGNIHLLDNDEVIIDGVRFLGCTLWTNFELFGSDPSVVGILREFGRQRHRRFSEKHPLWHCLVFCLGFRVLTQYKRGMAGAETPERLRWPDRGGHPPSAKP